MSRRLQRRPITASGRLPARAPECARTGAVRTASRAPVAREATVGLVSSLWTFCLGLCQSDELLGERMGGGCHALFGFLSDEHDVHLRS
jgi:hypothetical protein